MSSALPRESDIGARIQAAMDFHRRGQLAEAEAAYRQLIADNVAPAAVHSNLASIYVGQGRVAEGAASFARAVAADPNLADAHFNLGLCHQKQGKLEDAAGAFREAASRSPAESQTHARALQRLAFALRGLKRWDEEIATWQQLIELTPGNHQLYMELGAAHKSAGHAAETIAAFTRATELEPRNPLAFVNLGFALRTAVRLDESIACFAKAAELRPNEPAGHTNLGIMLSDHVRFGESAAAFRRALALKPNDAHAYSSLLYLLAHSQQQTPEEYLEIARGFERDVCAPLPPSPLTQKPIDHSRPVKIGFHSAEIGDHAVVRFLESYLRNYDRSRFKVYIYSAKPRHDSKSAEIQALADGFRDIGDLSDDDARRTIRSDEIDILIDTTGHTARGRLQMLSQRCAPIQCHWIGFVATTGVTAIDYFIGDDEMTPPEFSTHFSEKLVRLPKVWGAYTPAWEAPEPAQESPDGALTVGSCNNFIKVHERTLDLWSAVLNGVPQAKLLVKDWRCGDRMTRERITAHLRRRGVDAQRVTFLGRSVGWYEHMVTYNKLDIALDTTPYNSCTTGYDAIYMATPLVAMRTAWTGGRMSSSMLKALGRPEWVANTIEEYVDIVRKLAADLPRLKSFKKTLRSEMMQSPLTDGKAHTQAVEAAFLRMIADHNAAA